MSVTCTCEKPTLHVDERREGWCANCLKAFDPCWLSTDENLGEFLDRLEAASFPGAAPEVFKSFRRHCEAREGAGRKTFGLEYLQRDNLEELREEAVDGLLYAFLDSLQAVRENGEDDDFALALMIANYSFKAYEASVRLAARRRGSP